MNLQERFKLLAASYEASGRSREAFEQGWSACEAEFQLVLKQAKEALLMCAPSIEARSPAYREIKKALVLLREFE